ncbi:protein NUCLEAR FUSION DEFECTIVE 4-like isoform X2 [Tasmannia lanceolata]|uniref:protein NUCLEAR FUSION DEFECTIVE 4-like isoform X2 n=1 Tax=Tasmannia lanceolata TaxID=3420 RepID=UPI004063B4B0
MDGQSRKWMILVATIWIQAFTGTNFDFSAYSSNLKSVLGISQVQLNYLSVASDLGKTLGWSSGLALLYLPLSLVLFMASLLGLVGYGFQWLVINNFISLPYFVVFLFCLMAGCSICWFNTVCFVLCIRNFPVNRPLALALTTSFNGVSPTLYTLAANSISSSSSSLYLLLNAILPLLSSFAALVPILRHPPTYQLPPEAARRDSVVFLVLNILALLTGLYLLLLSSVSSVASTARLLFGGALLLLILPLCIPGIVYAREWACRIIHSTFTLQGWGFNLVDVDDLELHKELISRENNGNVDWSDGERLSWCERLLMGDQLVVLGEEHSVKMLVCRVDFWLYYLAYFWGATVGLVYSNNLGQITQSLGFDSTKTTLVAVYSAFSFFGRLLAAAPDFIRGYLH